MDAGADKLLHNFIDVIEAAYEKEMRPEQLMKFVKGWKTKTPKKIEDRIMIGVIAYMGQDKNFRGPRNSIKKFIKSKDFKMIIPKYLAVEKKFFTGNHNYYVTKKIIHKDLTVDEHRRLKFVENIYSSRWNKLKNTVKQTGKSSSGIARILYKRVMSKPD